MNASRTPHYGVASTSTSVTSKPKEECVEDIMAEPLQSDKDVRKPDTTHEANSPTVAVDVPEPHDHPTATIPADVAVTNVYAAQRPSDDSPVLSSNGDTDLSTSTVNQRLPGPRSQS
ncbi:hypothetical protein C8Q76DRAFT_248124 [Earliella scabrosa]|nr:hypothetical protein C8Q76DRAFT_248124 [Earliella scabrosa]